MIDFKLDAKSGIPFYRQIIDQIRFGIANGKLAVGEQLPTVRALAVELKINLNTVIKAYKELEIQRVLDSQQGTGTFINASGPALPDNERQEKLRAICSEYVTIASAYGFTVDEIVSELNHMKKGEPS
jgi:GntR family transcriptional regulator